MDRVAYQPATASECDFMGAGLSRDIYPTDTQLNEAQHPISREAGGISCRKRPRAGRVLRIGFHMAFEPSRNDFHVAFDIQKTGFQDTGDHTSYWGLRSLSKLPL
jgi:hypothetical protein